jgi:hypothetical protein
VDNRVFPAAAEQADATGAASQEAERRLSDAAPAAGYQSTELTMHRLLVGFDSEWTNRRTGAIIGALIDDTCGVSDLGSFTETRRRVSMLREVVDPALCHLA